MFFELSGTLPLASIKETLKHILFIDIYENEGEAIAKYASCNTMCCLSSCLPMLSKNLMSWEYTATGISFSILVLSCLYWLLSVNSTSFPLVLYEALLVQEVIDAQSFNWQNVHFPFVFRGSCVSCTLDFFDFLLPISTDLMCRSWDCCLIVVGLGVWEEMRSTEDFVPENEDWYTPNDCVAVSITLFMSELR